MVRVLQLYDTDAEFQIQRSIGGLSTGLRAEFACSTASIGRGGTYRSATRALVGLRRAPSCDVIHAWGMRSLVAASLSGRAFATVFTPPPEHADRAIRWLRALREYRNVHVVCSTATLRRRYLQRGIPLQRCHLIRPGVDFSRIRRRRDPALRSALGFAQDDCVILVPGESTRNAAHRYALWTSGILNLLDERYKFLLWGRGSQIPAIERFASRIRHTDLLHVAERRLHRPVEFEELLPAADIVLVTAAGPVGTLPISICMAAALPIVATVTYTLGELLEDRHTALLVPKASPRMLAQRILELREDPRLQWSISDMARTEAYEHFSMTDFLERHRVLYRQVASGRQVELPPDVPGAGSRFHGQV